MIMSVLFLIDADTYAAESSVMILSDTKDQDGLPDSNAENGLIADYYHFDKGTKAFTDYVSSEYVRMPFFSQNIESRKIHALRTVGFLDGRGVAFRGKIRFPESGLYVLSARSNRGVRVTIDDVVVIDAWENTSLGTISGRGLMVGGESVHDISIEYYYTSGDEYFSLYWEKDGMTERELIPESCFYPVTPRDTVIETAEFSGEGLLQLAGTGLEKITSVMIIPASIASVKEPVPCKITKKEESRILLDPSAELSPGTYRLEYISRKRVFRPDVSFWVNAGEDAAVQAAGSARREEHPRPDRYREEWISLNGAWRFDFDPGKVGEREKWYRQKDYTRIIQVPFAWQSDESWIGDDSYQGTAWYERDLTVDGAWLQDGKRCFLCFGAVDAEATVYVNGEEAGSHSGGYTPFEMDITDFVSAGQNKLTVEVNDEGSSKNSLYPALIGKQGYDATCGYTPVSGIWQSVFLECRGETYIDSLQIYTDVHCQMADVAERNAENGAESGKDYSTADCTVRFEAEIYSDREIDAFIQYHFSDSLWDDAAGKEISTGSDIAYSMDIHLQAGMNMVVSPDITVTGAKLWSDIEPNLYVGTVDLVNHVTAADGDEAADSESFFYDHLETYFGFRKVETVCFAGRDYEYICVNGRPVFLSGVLDQGFWPGSGYTAPTQEALKDDIVYLKECGFNTMRKHLKIEEPLQYYWCDRLGIYLMQDMPYATAMNAPEEGADAPGRPLYEETLEEFLLFSDSHPSLISIQLFNEGWGIDKPGLRAGDGMTTLEWQQHLYDLVKGMSSVLVEDMSPNEGDHIQPTDINSFHYYPTSFSAAKFSFDGIDAGTVPGGPANFREGFLQEAEPWINSEYGGVGVYSGDLDVSYCFKYQTDLLRQHEKLCGLVYTQAFDVEYERNGLRTFDRKEKVFGYDEIACGGDMGICDLVQPAYIGIEGEPVRRCLPGSEFSANVIGMNWSEKDYGEVTLHWVLEGTDTKGVRFGAGDVRRGLPSAEGMKSEESLYAGETGFSYPRYTKNTKTIDFTLPDKEGVAVLTVWLEKDGVKIAKNFIYIVLRDEHPDPTIETGEEKYVLRADLDEKYVEGSGTVTLHFTGSCLELQSYLKTQERGEDDKSKQVLSLVMELSSVKEYRSVDGIRHAATSQTAVGDELPGIVDVFANGIYLDTLILDDAPRDMRGALTLQNDIYGSTSAGDFGELMFVEADSEKTSLVLESIEEMGGLDVTLTVPEDSAYANGVRVYDDMEGRYMVRPAVIIRRQ